MTAKKSFLLPLTQRYTDQRISPQRRGELVLLLTAITWGTSFVAIQQITSQIAPMVMLTLRFAIATLVLLPLVSRRHFTTSVMYQGAQLGMCLFVGFGLQTASLMYTTAAHAAFGISLVTVLVPILSFFVWRQSWPLGTYVSLIASLWGTASLMGFEAEASMRLGDILSLLGAVAFAVHILLLNRFSRESEMLPLLIGQLLSASVLTAFAWLILREPWPNFHNDHAWRTFGIVCYLGIFTTALCTLGQIYGQARTSSTRVAFLLALEPVSAAAFAYFVDGQVLNTSEWFGGLLIVLAALFADQPLWQRRTRIKAPQSPPDDTAPTSAQ